MVIMYMVNDTFILNTVTIYRYGILAFGSMMCIDRFLITVYSILYNIVEHNCICEIHSLFSAPLAVTI